MKPEHLIAYHSERAMRELDLGLIASSTAAAKAHLKLSSLHLARVRELGGGAGRGPILTM